MENYRSERANLWVLSGGSGPNFLSGNWYPYKPINIKIDLMDWINNYTKYFNIGNFIVYEFLQPETTILTKELASRYNKAQNALEEMKRQIGYGEWKLAIIAMRPIFELFKNFEEFKSILIKSGYTQSAYDDLNNAVRALFNFISKFHHALEQNYREINAHIPAEKEDVYLAYSFSVSLLHLFSQKIRRVN